MSLGKAAVAKVRAEMNRAKAMEYRKAGATVRQIAESLEVSKSQAHRYILQGLKETKSLREDLAEDLREMELLRLDRALQAVYPKVQSGDLSAVDRLIRISERRCKILGIDAPQKLAPTDPGGENPYSGLSDAELKKRIDAAAAQA